MGSILSLFRKKRQRSNVQEIKHVNLLFLGSKGSGKTTFHQQWKSRLESGYDEDKMVLSKETRSTDIAETMIRVRDVTWRLFDVASWYRPEMAKGPSCIDNATVIFYMIDLSEYDQLLEGSTTTRLEEASELCNAFLTTSYLLEVKKVIFFNKVDLFKKKLLTSPMKSYFADYEGGTDYAAAVEYITQRFYPRLTKQVCQPDEEVWYSHYVSVTDSVQMGFVMAATMDIVMFENLQDARVH